MCFSQLPDVCLNVVFDNLPLGDLVRVNAVSRKWNSIQRTALKRRRQLVLLIGKRPALLMLGNNLTNLSVKYEHLNQFQNKTEPNGQVFLPTSMQLNILRFSNLTITIVHHLAQALPNIQNLQISLDGVTSKISHQVAYLLKHWNTNLTCFKVWFRAAEYEDAIEASDDGIFHEENLPIEYFPNLDCLLSAISDPLCVILLYVLAIVSFHENRLDQFLHQIHYQHLKN